MSSPHDSNPSMLSFLCRDVFAIVLSHLEHIGTANTPITFPTSDLLDATRPRRVIARLNAAVQRLEERVQGIESGQSTERLAVLRLIMTNVLLQKLELLVATFHLLDSLWRQVRAFSTGHSAPTRNRRIRRQA
ncbi:hypothetical protein D9615_006867 [Tricholomella constricta]|uniref:Uncharacterized protein n=1 Tax=Tricholomella constricta TaxID=117010 RepID=A0A8H5M2Z5_9AGAR|nr:hypothetical protein D9615_006867 [Tricholomella constricta]